MDWPPDSENLTMKKKIAVALTLAAAAAVPVVAWAAEQCTGCCFPSCPFC